MVTTRGGVPRGPPLRPQEAAAGIPPQLQPLAGSIQAWQAASDAERAAFVTWMIDVGLESQRQTASAAIHLQHRRRAEQASTTAGTLFAVLAGLSLLMLVVPLFVSRARAPRRLALWGHAVLAVITLLVTFGLLWLCVELLMSLTSTVASQANPEQGLLDAGFDRIRNEAHAALQGGAPSGFEALPYGPLVGAGTAQDSGGYIANILRSLEYFDPQVFEPAVMWTQRTWALLGFVPLIVPILVVLVILLTMRHTILQVLRMPVAAARGEKGTGLRALGVALRFVGRELLAVLSLVVALLPVGILTSLAVRHLSRHLIGLLLAQTRTSIAYFGQLGTEPDQAPLTFGMIALPAFLALATLMSVGGVGLYAFRARRLLQQKFHQGLPLRRPDRVWRRSFLAMLRLQWIPVLLLWLLAPRLVGLHAGAIEGAPDALARLTGTGARLAVAFPIAFVCFGGLGALRTLWPLRRLKPAARESYALRPSTEADHAFLRRAHREGLRPWVEATWGWDAAVQERLVGAWLSTTTAQVVLVDGREAGYLEVVEGVEHVQLASLVLLPGFQRRGLGTRILQDLLARADGLSLPVRLQVLHENPARELYQRLGFRVVGADAYRARMLRPPPRVP